MKEKSAAILTIKDAAKMSPEGRRRIAKWLRRQAAFVIKHGKDCAPQFRARYLYR